MGWCQGACVLFGVLVQVLFWGGDGACVFLHRDGRMQGECLGCWC